MNYLEHNRRVWNHGVMATSICAQPVGPEIIRRARAGDWEVLLTPKTPVPKEWLANVAGKEVLCLASGGGQQAPVLAAAGAKVLSFDLSDEQLAKDQMVASREGLDVRCVQGNMADLSALDSALFDLIFHPASNVFVPDLTPVWRECYRVLRPGGILLAGFMNPAAFMFDHQEADSSGQLVARFSLPYSDESSLSRPKLQARREAQEPLEFSHSLTTQIGGQIEAGFVITGFYEDGSQDPTWLFGTFSPVAMATRALRPG